MSINTAVYAAPGFKNSPRFSAAMGSGQGLGAMSGVKTALIVDDSAVERENLLGILSAADISVLVAENGEAAVELATAKQPDIIFLDIMMPGMDGFATCRALQAGETTHSIPIVMVSSKANRSDKVWAEQMGATGYIIKPYTAQDILEKIEQVG